MRTVLTGVLGPVPGYDRIHWASAAHALTGQSMGSAVRCIVTDWLHSLFFWKSKLIMMQSADDRSLLVCGIGL